MVARPTSALGLLSDFVRKGLLVLGSGYVRELAAASYPHIQCGGGDFPGMAGGVQDERAALAAFVGGGERDFDAEITGFVGLALTDARGSGRMPRVQLPAALALLLAADLRGPANRNSEDLLQRSVAVDLAPDVADDPAQAGA